MKIQITSDSHGILPKITSPCDVFIHCGDACPTFEKGKYSPQMDADFQWNWLQKHFKPWWMAIPARYKILTGSNHDRVLQVYRQDCDNLLGEDLLIDSTRVIEGVKFYGLPWTLPAPSIIRWAFEATESQMETICDTIPDDTEVLVSHGAPFGYLDMDGIGCQALANRIKQLDQLKVCVFGHLHNTPGIIREGKIIYCNTAQQVTELEIDF